MGLLKEFKCEHCGYVIEAPDNRTGRYAVMSGTIQMFLWKERHCITEIQLSSRYFKDDDDVNDVEANRLISQVIENGDPMHGPEEFNFYSRFPSFRNEIKVHLSAWNAITGACPKCSKKMVKCSDITTKVD